MTNFRRHVFVATVLLVFGAWLASAARADDTASSCSNTTINGGANDCYTITPPFTDGSGITINGIENGAEWSGAVTKNLTGDFTGTVKVMRSATALYLLIHVNDTTYDPSDQIRVFFDPLHNHASTGDDIEFQIKRDTGSSPNHRKIVGGTDSAWNPATNGSELGRNSPSDWTVELKLTAAELGVSDLPPILGFGIQAEDNPNNNLSVWPVNFDSTHPATSWANLKTRYPIEYMLVLDRSFSMTDQNKWTNTKKAVNFLANTMAILREPSYFDDKLGVVTFTDHYPPPLPIDQRADATVVAKPLATIGPFPLGDYADAAPGVGNPEGATPIGRGLDLTFTTVGTSISEETQRVALLMSDGIHNAPTSQVPLLPAYLSYQPCGGAWGVCSSSVVAVDTVALGEDSGVDTDLLDKIRHYYSGPETGTTYNITTDVELLKQSFIESLDDLFHMNMVSAGASGAEFTVDPNNRKLFVILSWTNPASAVTFTLQRKVNPGDPWIDVACNQSGAESVAVGYGVCVVNDPPAGTWRAVDATKNPLVTANRQFVLLDLHLRARFAVDQVAHGTGMDMILTADLNEGGVPVTDSSAHPVKVTVAINKPTEGFGTLVSTHDLNTCKQIEPRFPGRVQPNPEPGPSHQPPPGVLSGATLAKAIVVPTGVDSKTARFLAMDKLLKACNKSGLNRADESGVQLFDDGTHGDVTANDGVYTLRFTNTQFEGSYIFDFKAVGTSPAGNKFTRVKRTAAYARVNVDPASTPLNSVVLGQVGTVVTRAYYVTPRDRFGGYLGLGFPEEIQFTAIGGQWQGPVVDLDNGMYARVLKYDSKFGEPVVVPVVQGQPVGQPLHLLPWWLWLLIILILIIIIIVLLLWRRK